MLIPRSLHALAKNIFNICIASLLQTYMQLIDNWHAEVFANSFQLRTPWHVVNNLLGNVRNFVEGGLFLTVRSLGVSQKSYLFFGGGRGGGKTLLLSYITTAM